MSEDTHHGPEHYVKIWAILVGLLVLSVLGPMAEIKWLTLGSAFGIAIIKAGMVVVNFMHLTIEKKYITYIVSTCLVFMFLLFAATSPDIMNDSGSNWEKNQEMLHPPIVDSPLHESGADHESEAEHH